MKFMASAVVEDNCVYEVNTIIHLVSKHFGSGDKRSRASVLGCIVVVVVNTCMSFTSMIIDGHRGNEPSMIIDGINKGSTGGRNTADKS